MTLFKPSRHIHFFVATAVRLVVGLNEKMEHFGTFSVIITVLTIFHAPKSTMCQDPLSWISSLSSLVNIGQRNSQANQVGRETFRNARRLELIRITPSQEKHLLKLAELRAKYRRLDFWTEPVGVGIPVDVLAGERAGAQLKTHLTNSVSGKKSSAIAIASGFSRISAIVITATSLKSIAIIIAPTFQNSACHGYGPYLTLLFE